MTLEAFFVEPGERSRYSATLEYAAGDSLFFQEEAVQVDSYSRRITWTDAGTESGLIEAAQSVQLPAAKILNEHVARLSFFHFHDTSPTSPLRQNSRQSDDRTLHSDGSNLATFLYRLKTSESEDAQRSWSFITAMVRRVAPFIKELVPDLVDRSRPEQSAVRLYWTDERDHRFDVHDLSDGTLRAIALFTALGQPSSSRPSFITIDEPELGLHPAAVSIFASLVRSVSEHCQILLATQSPALLDEFEPEDVVVTDRVDGASTFRRLSTADLAAWLDDYSLSELYDKNVLGGRP